MNINGSFGFFSEPTSGGGIPFVPERDDFIATPAQTVFVLTFVPIVSVTLCVYVLGILWQPSRYTVTFNGVAWEVTLDTPQVGGEDVAVVQ